MTTLQKRKVAGAAITAALLIGALTPAQAQAAGGRQVYDRPGSYSLQLPSGVQEFTVVLVGGGGGGGGGGVYSDSDGTGGGGGGGGAAGLAKCTVTDQYKDIGKIVVQVGGGGSGGWRGGDGNRPAPGGGGGGGGRSAVFVEAGSREPDTLAALAGGGGGGGGGGGWERRVGPRSGWAGKPGEGGGGGPRAHAGVGGWGGKATWNYPVRGEIGGGGGGGGGYLCSQLGYKGYYVKGDGAVSDRGGDAHRLTAGSAGPRGSFPTFPADVPATAGQGSAGGSGGEHHTGGARGGDGYVVISW
ncbi:hypothetical protein [Streptomyces klenkii]